MSEWECDVGSILWCETYIVCLKQNTKVHKAQSQDNNAHVNTVLSALSLTAGIIDPYVPPEGDARLSSLSKEGLKQRTEQIRQSAASQLA